MNERGSVGPWPWPWPSVGGGGGTVEVGRRCRLAGDMAGSIRGRCGGIGSERAISASIERAFGVGQSAAPSSVRASSATTCAAWRRFSSIRVALSCIAGSTIESSACICGFRSSPSRTFVTKSSHVRRPRS